MVIIALMSVSAAHKREDASGWHVHTLEVLLYTERFRGVLDTAQRSSRVSDIAAALALLARMQHETADNPRQQRNIALLSASLRRGSNAQVTGPQLDRIAGEEQRLLRVRTVAVMAADQRIRSYMWMLSGLGASMLTLAGLLVWGAARSQRRSDATLAERECIQEELSNTGAMLRTIVETTSGLIYAKDIEGRMILANPPAIALLGRSWAEIEGRTDAELLNNASEGHAVMETDRRIMDTGIPETVEENISTSEGQLCSWLSTKTPLRGIDGIVFGMVGMSVDITKRKQTEQRLQTVQDDLVRMARLGAMGELSLAVAHELNQPLAAVVNHLSIAEHLATSSGPIDRPELVRRLGDASDQAMRAGGIIKRLSSFVEQSEADKRIQRVSDLVEEAIAYMSANVASQSIKIDFPGAHGEVLVLADRVQIQLVLINLIRNACEALLAHARPSPSIEIGVLSRAESMVDIVIADNGPGIPADIQANLFKRFSTSQSRPGGLGIPISMRVIESHAGTLSYAAGKNGGARLTISLPTA